MVPSPMITITTDFGRDDAYVAAMKGTILHINPTAKIIDVSHNVSPQNIKAGAFLLKTATPLFPQGSIHVAVVDSGVGTERKAILVKTPDAFFIAPDNGLLSYVISPHDYQVYQLTNPSYWQHPVSSTFHGRDIFAPVAAYLSLGVRPEELGTLENNIIIFPFPRPQRLPNGSVEDEVLHIDHFGNLTTNINVENLPKDSIVVLVHHERIEGLSQSYSEGKGLLALIGSSGYLEISFKDNSAAKSLKAEIGTKIRVFKR